MQEIDLLIDKTDNFHPNLVDRRIPYVSTSIANKIIDTRYFEEKFASFKNSLAKPLAVYVINAEKDETGAVVSVKGLRIATYQCQVYSERYSVKGLISYSNKDLNSKLESIKENISVLHIRSHGSCLRSWDNPYLKNISSSTQVLLEACTTFDEANPSESISYKISDINQCEVFAAPSKINFSQPVITINNRGSPKIKSLGAFSYDGKPVKSYILNVSQKAISQDISI